MIVEVDGLDQFRKELRDVDRAWPKALKGAHTEIAKDVEGKARSNAAQGGPSYNKAKAAIKGRSTQDSASIGVSNTSRAPFAQAVFWGALGRAGWYAAAKYAESQGRQFPAWVGNNWEAASRSEGPYVINYTLAEELDHILDEYERMLADIASAAFPD